ncbi:dihydrolipoamide acetyltransferase family protein [Microlunatus parietis]|uniref:Dihydrolipoamide acetyltransferase component of pyruvate dehydrogenase complex n=1 Tax=Microlunatus parietis TaxID=682979 RepID=A0A7Y9I9X7_9ACTN|nr:dihydrolipoamide acetyltransferase family protein [Microlunatus parietis]NYE72499.1 pyruvate dehydrogenase E2 component (dihydrolipoamide acetyltransferase) [Microlunatus parietis]
MKNFLLPDPGEGLVEAEIVTWRVKPGDQVKINDILVEVETSKSLVELPSPFEGTIKELLVPEGQLIDVGTPIVIIDDGEEPDEEAPVANLVGSGPKKSETRRRPRKGAAAAEAGPAEAHDQFVAAFQTAAPVSRRADEQAPLRPGQAEPSGSPLPDPGPAPAEPAPTGGAVLAKPPVRKLAKDLGLDLTTITGTGEGGVITRADVEQAATTTSPEPVEGQATPVLGTSTSSVHELFEERIPIKGVRKATAAAVTSSAFTAPHVTEWLTCDVTATMELLDRLKQRRDLGEVRWTPLVVVAKAVLLALGRTPELHSSWDEANREIVLRRGVNLGIAAATPRGLLVPNLKGAHADDLVTLAHRIDKLVKAAKEGKTQPADTSGGTFTITNIGVFGIDGGTPILNPGEAGILCMGAIQRRPWVVGTGAEERIEPRWVTTLAVSFDHRLVDGEQGSRFLADVARVLTDPAQALLF